MQTARLYATGAGALDLHYFATPRLWRHYPFLPVVRRPRTHGPPPCGLLYDARGVSDLYGYACTVFLANLFALPRTEAALLARPKLVYDSFEEVADAGWVVD